MLALHMQKIVIMRGDGRVNYPRCGDHFAIHRALNHHTAHLKLACVIPINMSIKLRKIK